MNIIAAILAASFTFSPTAIPENRHNKVERTTRIVESPGGNVTEFIETFIAMRERGDRLIIAGECASACTLFLGLLPRERVCGVPNKAVLGFHTASEIDPREPLPTPRHSPMGSAFIWSLYPEAVRKLVRLGGWNGDDPMKPHPDLVLINTDNGLFSIINVCPVSDWGLNTGNNG